MHRIMRQKLLSCGRICRIARIVCAAVLLCPAVSCTISGGDGIYTGVGADFEVRGTVLDGTDRTALGGIAITYVDRYFGPSYCVTDAEGRFELKGSFVPSSNISLHATDIGDGQNWKDYAPMDYVVMLVESESVPGMYQADNEVEILLYPEMDTGGM